MSNRKPRYEAVHRILQMIGILERSPRRTATISSLAERLEVDTRTVDRYAKALAESYHPRLGGPLLLVEGSGSSKSVHLTNELLGHEESFVHRYAAVWASTRMLTAGEGSLLGDTAEGALDVVRSTLGGRARSFADGVEKAFHYIPFGPKDLRASDDVLDALLHALIYRRVVEVRRRRRDGEKIKERLEPYTIVMYRDGLYLLAKQGRADENWLRTYALERFDNVDVVRESAFEIPDDFDPVKYFDGRFGLWEPVQEPSKVELAFTNGAAEVLSSRQWPGPNRWRAEGGRMVLELEISATPELVSWIVSWGPQVQVLGPTELRDWVVSELVAAVDLYETVRPTPDP